MGADADLWAATTDGARIVAAYGYVPSLHDASVAGFDYDRASNRLTLTLDYYDTPEGGDRETLRCRFSFVFDSLVRCVLEMYDNDVSFGRVSRAEEGFRLELERGVLSGEIVSHELDIRIVELPSEKPEPGWYALRLTLS